MIKISILENLMIIPKSLLRSLLCFALLSLAVSSCGTGPTSPADPTSVSVAGNPNPELSTTQSHSGKASKFSALDLGSGTFVVDNESSQSLGEVEISGSAQNAFINVGADEVDSTTIAFTAQSVTIASQMCPYPMPTIIQLPNGSVIKEKWESPSIIKIIDYGEQN